MSAEAKLYIIRARTSDGQWHWDEDARPLRETKKLATINRVMAGVTAQIWPEAEARIHIKREKDQKRIAALESVLRKVVKEASGYVAIGFDHDDESAQLQAALDEAVVILEEPQ